MRALQDKAPAVVNGGLQWTGASDVNANAHGWRFILVKKILMPNWKDEYTAEQVESGWGMQGCELMRHRVQTDNE